MERPTVTVWHDTLLSVNERRMTPEQQLEEGQGHDIMEGDLPGFWNKILGPKLLPIAKDLKAQAENPQDHVPPKNEPAPGGKRRPAKNPKALTDSQGDSAAPVSKRRKALAITADCGAASGGAGEPAASKGGKAMQEKSTHQLPSLRDCLMNQHGRGKLTGNQVLYHCKQAMEGAFETGQMDQLEYTRKKNAHRVLVLACALAPGSIEKATDADVFKCYTEVLEADRDALPTRFYFNVLKRHVLKMQQKEGWVEDSEALRSLADPTPPAGDLSIKVAWGSPLGGADLERAPQPEFTHWSYSWKRP